MLCLGLFFIQSNPAQKPIEPTKSPVSPIKLETPQEANDRIAQLALAASAKQGEYIIGTGDLLTIEVFDVPELSREVRVNESGLISIPLLPMKVQAAGLTPFQLQDSLAELLRSNGLVSRPQITVQLKELHSEPITVIGSVKQPTVIQSTHQMTLLEVLSQVGGINADAGSQIIITRPARPSPGGSAKDGKEQPPMTLTVDLDELIDSGDSQYNIPVLGGDVIRVPRAGMFYVVGAVQHAGGFVMQSDRQQMTVLKAVTLAGGLQPTARGTQAVILRKDSLSGERKHIPINLQKVLKLKTDDVALLQSDILYVPDSLGKRAMRRTGDIAISLATGAAMYRVATF